MRRSKSNGHKIMIASDLGQAKPVPKYDVDSSI